MRKLLCTTAMSSALFWYFAGFQAQAQTSGPRKPPTTRTLAPAIPTADRSVSDSSNNPAEVKVINGLELTLMTVKGSSVGQTVTATLMIKNPSGDTDVCAQQAYAVDTDGNQYMSNTGRNCNPLYTDVPLKWEQGVKGVPSKVKSLAIFTFNLYNKSTRKLEKVEFRNLTIEWQ